MATLRDIQKRIRSVKNTQKITRAMKLVAAAKLRRAQENMLMARPYALALGAMLRRLATRASEEGEAAAHPLLELRPLRRVLLLVLTSDRGLCGGFNGNILRRAETFIDDQGSRFDSLEIGTVGRRGADYFRKRKITTVRDYPGVFEELTFRRATEIANGMAQEFIDRDLDAVFLVYNEFKSAMTQRVVVTDLLPIVREELPAGEDIDYIYEPDRDTVLERLAPRYIATLVWRALLESFASEQGARMTAMENATQNASELVDTLTLQYNRARQARITTDLMDIVGGAEALQG